MLWSRNLSKYCNFNCRSRGLQSKMRLGEAWKTRLASWTQSWFPFRRNSPFIVLRRVLWFCSRETATNAKWGTCRIGKKARTCVESQSIRRHFRLSSRHQKVIPEIMEIFPKNPTRNWRYSTARTIALCNTRWNVTDKGGNRSKVQMKRYLNCHTYTYLMYVSRLSRWLRFPPFAFPRKFSYSLLPQTSKSAVFTLLHAYFR